MMRPAVDLVVLAQQSDQVLNAILSMADRQNSLFRSKRRELRRKVLELVAIVPGYHSWPG